LPGKHPGNAKDPAMADENTQKHLYDLVKDFRTAMLITRAGGALHARPMSVAELRADAHAYFATGMGTPKVAEIEADPCAMITFQDGSQFAVITGQARIVRDRALIDKLWSEAWRAWFPGGKDDPTLCLIRFEAREGEYWDNSGLKGMRYLFEGVKAVIQGGKPATGQDQHAKVKL
jgi:general stress protein 26